MCIWAAIASWNILGLISSWDFGTVPEWIGAIGTVAAVGWAVFLYRRSLEDQEIAQARLLSIVNGAVPVSVSPMTLPEVPSTVRPGVDTGLFQQNGVIKSFIVSEALQVGVHLVSTSNETFNVKDVALIQDDGKVHDFKLTTDAIEPGVNLKSWNYYPPQTVSGGLRVRVRFQDASGRYWVRYNDEPVRKLKKSEIAEINNPREDSGGK